uniref:Toxin-antitoxin system HicB family antitoxin n=1 Tax=Chlorobium chlorochromatii (strain CaD3) TaxID=340177 RepID=Q3AT57_CHLCH
MSTINIQLPNSLHIKMQEVARQNGVSLDQFIATAIAEKLAALMTVNYLRERTERSSQEDFERALSEIPDVAPEEFDKL